MSEAGRSLPSVTTLLPGFMLGSDQGEFAFCAVNLIEAVDSDGRICRIVVDTGHIGRHGVLRRALEGRGLAPEDIDVVVLTHAHWDHVQNVSLFERARILVHPEELRYARSPHRNDHATPPWTGAILDRHDIREVCEGSEIVPGVTVLEAPGHSAGTVAVVVETDMGLAVVTGDAIQDGRVAAEGRNALVFWNEEQADRSVRKILDVADVVYPGHDRPFRMDRGRPDYLEEFALTIHHVTAETPGLGFEVWPERTREVMPGITEQTSATGRAKQ